jgi:hypothetical protein
MIIANTRHFTPPECPPIEALQFYKHLVPPGLF